MTPMRLARQRNRAGVDAVVGRELVGGGERIGMAVDLGVAQRALDGLAVVGKDLLDPLVVEQPRAVDELVQHARGEIVG